MADGLPELIIQRAALSETNLIDVFTAETLKLAASRGEVRRLIKGGGAKLNGKAISDGEACLQETDFDADGKAQISAGKKRHAILILAE